MRSARPRPIAGWPRITGYDEQGQTRFTVPVGADRPGRGRQRRPRRRVAALHPCQLRRCRTCAVSSSDMYAGRGGRHHPLDPPRGQHRDQPARGGRHRHHRRTALGPHPRRGPARQLVPPASILDAAAYTYSPAGALATIKAAHQAGAADSTWSYSYDWLGQRQSPPPTPTPAPPPTTTTPSGNLTKTEQPGRHHASPTTTPSTGRLTRRDKDGRGQGVVDLRRSTGRRLVRRVHQPGRPTGVHHNPHRPKATWSPTAAGYEADGDLKGSTATWPAPWTSPGATHRPDRHRVGWPTTTTTPPRSPPPTTRRSTTPATWACPRVTSPADYTTGGLWAQDTTDGGDTVIGKADYNWHNQPIGLDSQHPETRQPGCLGPATGVQLAGRHRLPRHPRRQDRRGDGPDDLAEPGLRLRRRRQHPQHRRTGPPASTAPTAPSPASDPGRWRGATPTTG